MEKDKFTERELQLIENCLQYADNNPAGVPGHNLMLIIAKFASGVQVDQETNKANKQ